MKIFVFFLGKAISTYIESQNKGDELLWRFITLHIDDTEDIDGIKLNMYKDGLLCDRHRFHSENFLKQRMCVSDFLLTTAIHSVEKWSDRGWGFFKL
jgi:hypothetical protein